MKIQSAQNLYNFSFTNSRSDGKNTTRTPLFLEDKSIQGNAINGAGIAIVLRFVQKGINLLSETCAQLLMAGKEFASGEKVQDIAKRMKADNGLKVDIHFIDEANKNNLIQKFPNLADSLDIVAKGQNAFYTEKFNFAVAPKTKPSLILHELGHATNFEKGKFTKFLQRLRPVSAYAPMGLVLLNSAVPKKDTNKPSFIERHAGKIGFLTMLPTIIEEGVASFKGIKGAKNILGNASCLKSLKRNYFFAWMTYLLAGVAIGVASKIAVLENSRRKTNTSGY